MTRSAANALFHHDSSHIHPVLDRLAEELLSAMSGGRKVTVAREGDERFLGLGANQTV